MQTSIAKKSLLLLATVLVSGSAWSEWVKVSETAAGRDFYIDPSTIRTEGNLRKVWEIQNTKQRDESGAKSTRSRVEFDCQQERSRTLALSAHTELMAGGTTIVSSYGERTSNAWSEIPPQSVAAVILKMVCAK